MSEYKADFRIAPDETDPKLLNVIAQVEHLPSETKVAVNFPISHIMKDNDDFIVEIAIRSAHALLNSPVERVL